MLVAGQAADARGYAMAALLVALGVMAVLWTMAIPSWRHLIQREREAELIFRGEQYARAIGLFQRKYANAFPPNIEVLLDQKFLRRRYTDPVAKGPDKSFQILYQTSQGGRPGEAGQPGPGSATGGSASGPQPVGPRGGVTGVVSKSKDKSIRLYKGRDRYNEWQFVYTPATQTPGGTPGGTPGIPPARPGGTEPPVRPPAPSITPR